PVERRVGGRQELGQLTARAGVERRDADGDRDGHALGSAGTVRVDGQVGDVRTDPFGDPERVYGSGLRKQHHELLTAEPAGEVIVAKYLGDRGRDLPEHIVAEQVAVRVVDLLEPVKVEQRHGERRPGADGPDDFGRRLAL